MLTKVFVMAQGQQSRMHRLPIRKHLLCVNGETLLARICRQVREREAIPHVFCWPDVHIHVGAVGGYPMDFRYPGSCILDGMHASTPWWCDERNIFLLGDVVYSERAMDKVFGFNRDVQFFGTEDMGRATGELFAYVMRGRPVVNQTAELLLIAPCRGVNSKLGQGGHLRELVWLWMKMLGLQGTGILEYNVDLLTVFGDWTSDIDTDLQVQELLPQLETHVRQEREAIQPG